MIGQERLLLPPKPNFCSLITFNYCCWRSVRLKFYGKWSQLWYRILLKDIKSYCFVRRFRESFPRGDKGLPGDWCSRDVPSVTAPLRMALSSCSGREPLTTGRVACYPFSKYLFFIFCLSLLALVYFVL